MTEVRTDEDFVAQAGHAYWGLRQVLDLGAHLETLRRDGRVILSDAVDAAALEAFLVHARALTEFFWGQHKIRRDGTRVYPDDARAADWFGPRTERWAPGPMPESLRDLLDRVGFGVAHLSFRRIDGESRWEHLDVAHHLASRFYEFASTAPKDRLPDHFERTVYEKVMGYRAAVMERAPFDRLRNPPQPVGTPGFAVAVLFERNDLGRDGDFRQA